MKSVRIWLSSMLVAMPLLAVPVVVGTAGPAEAATCGAWGLVSGGRQGAYAWCDKGPKYRVGVWCRYQSVEQVVYGPWVTKGNSSNKYCPEGWYVYDKWRDVA
jgi:hypothetical protein